MGDLILDKLAEGISNYLIANKIIDIDDRDIYIYGLQLILSTLITSISILTLGLLIGELISAIIYLSVYFFLKSYTGGYHAKSYYGCYFYSIINYVVLLVIRNTILDSYKPIIGLLSLIISIATIVKFVPIENKNNPKTKEEMIKNRKISINRTMFLSIFITLGYLGIDKLIDLWFMLAITELSIAYSILKQKIKGGKQHEK